MDTVPYGVERSLGVVAVMIAEATKIATDLAGLAHALGDLSAAVAGLVTPWAGPIAGVIAALYARRALVVSKIGNEVADSAAKSAGLAVTAATEAGTLLAAKIDDHNATQSFLIQKGIERSEFERAIAIGAAQASQPAPLGKS